MNGWLVTALPSWLLLFGLILVIAGAALLLRRFLQRRFPVLSGDAHNDSVKFIYGFIGFVYAFFIGFVVSSMWSQINTADASARAEGAGAVQLASDAVVFDTADRDRVRESLLRYERAAIDEWSRLPARRLPETDAALARLYGAYGQVRATNDAQKTLLGTSYSNLDKISQARTARIATAREDTGPPWPLWAVIFITSVLVVGTVVVYGVEQPRMHYPMVAIVAVVVAANLFLVLELAHPYIGVISTSSDPLQEAVSVLTAPGA